MKILIIILLVFFSFNACRTVRPVLHTNQKDSVVTVTVTEKVTVTEYLPGDTVELWQAIPCPEAVVDRTVKKGNTSLSVQLKNGQLNVRCNSDSLQRIIDSIKTSVHKEVYREKTISIPIDKPVPYIPKWVWWLIAANTFYLFWRFRKPLIKLLKPTV
jgi:heme/copper-type cytochrome/quinol oxidase subunit 2